VCFMKIKDHIQNEAIGLFFRHGIRSITMDEIASQAGVSKKTIYQWFVDKDELVEAVINKELKKDEQECHQCRKEAKNAIHECFLALDMVQDMLKTMNPLIIYDLQRYYPRVYKKFKDHKNTFMVNIKKDNLIRGIKEDLYRSDIQADIVARAALENVFMGFDPDVFSHNKYSLNVIQQELFYFFLYGIASTKGHKMIYEYRKQRLKNK